MEISPEYSFKGLTLKLKLQYFGHLMQRTIVHGAMQNAIPSNKKLSREWRVERV